MIESREETSAYRKGKYVVAVGGQRDCAAVRQRCGCYGDSGRESGNAGTDVPGTPHRQAFCTETRQCREGALRAQTQHPAIKHERLNNFWSDSYRQRL